MKSWTHLSIDTPPLDLNQLGQFTRWVQVMSNTLQRVRRFVIPLPDGKTPYLERIILDESTPLGKTYLHIIYEPDGDRDPHCHPWDFESKIVYGSYEEKCYAYACVYCKSRDLEPTEGGDRCRECKGLKAEVVETGTNLFTLGQTNCKRAHEFHRITRLNPYDGHGPVVTLVTRGPQYREWGFATPEGWENHASYIKRKFPDAQPTEVD